MPEHAIRIPRSSPDSTEATLVDKLVEEGGQATQGEPLFVIATEKVEVEVAADATGTVHWSAEVEADYDIGTEIGVIQTDS
jgi:pyruvate/2-oxoglutarate dehydrogenase complex dihydrolipoamide acyltransferase (E2) component